MRPLVILSTFLIIGVSSTLISAVRHGNDFSRRDDLALSRNIAYVPPVAQAQQAEKEDTTQILFDWSAEPNHIIPWLRKNERLLNRGDGCTLFVSWSSRDPNQGFRSSADYNIASLVVAPEDDETQTVIRDKISGSGQDMRVGVQYHIQAMPGPAELRIALAPDGPEHDVFAEISRAEAITVRYQDWKLLMVVKPIRVSEVEYRYTFSCENGKTFLSFLRRPTNGKNPARTKPQ